MATKLSLGSSVSFYFDGRLAVGNYDTALVEELLRIARIEHDAVVGKLSGDGMTLEVDCVANLADLEDFRRRSRQARPSISGRSRPAMTMASAQSRLTYLIDMALFDRTLIEMP